MSEEPVNPWEGPYKHHVEEAWQIFLERNAEYEDAFTYMGVLGIVVEVVGLAHRLKALVVHRPGYGQDRSHKIYDALLDVVNFCLMGLMMIDDNNYTGKGSNRQSLR